MNRVNRYIFSNFISTFASQFSTLFLIMSIAFFLQIARITSYIEITFFELFKLYLFMLPRVLLFTIPIAFFVSLSMMLFRLSKENESIVLFTLGHSPALLAKFFIKISLIVSAVLLATAIILVPTAAQLHENFINYKKTVAKLNIKTTQFGQKFSNWLIYANGEKTDENGTIYEQVTMYSPKKNEHRLIIAQNAKITNSNSNLELRLENGTIYEMGAKSWHKADFSFMKIYTTSSNSSNETLSFLDYWSKTAKDQQRARNFITYVLIALFPIATTLFAISFGIVTHRYEKGFIYFGVFGVLFAYFTALMTIFTKPSIAIPAIFFVFFISSFMYFKKTILKRY
ncbi:MAG: LptF/LptG family permease [Campylobacter sp.]